LESHIFRKIFVLFSYTAVIVSSLSSVGKFTMPALSLLGVIIFIISMTVASKIHSMFPKGKHNKPDDFEKLLTDGPYSYCRHPFYLSLIINQLSISLVLMSWLGSIVCLLLFPGWYALIKLEEKELIEYWGNRYLEYMDNVPTILPFIKRRR